MYYPSKNNNALNTRPFAPERITGLAMVNPHYPVDLAPGTRYVIDSGAFQERDMLSRLQPWTALDRQLRLEAQIEYGSCGLPAEAIVTYDMLAGVDEAIVDGRRVKRRGTEATAAPAVAETLRSAREYHRQRDRVRGAIAYAAQGVTVAQYVGCVRSLLPLMRPGRDWLAFGGLCITGMQRGRMLPIFRDILAAVVPLLAAAGIHRAHILGVCVPEAIQHARALEVAHPSVALSTDSSAPELGAIFGRTYAAGDGRQRTGYTKDQKYVDYHPRDLAHANVRDYHAWISSLPGTQEDAA